LRVRHLCATHVNLDLQRRQPDRCRVIDPYPVRSETKVGALLRGVVDTSSAHEVGIRRQRSIQRQEGRGHARAVRLLLNDLVDASPLLVRPWHLRVVRAHLSPPLEMSKGSLRPYNSRNFTHFSLALLAFTLPRAGTTGPETGRRSAPAPGTHHRAPTSA